MLKNFYTFARRYCAPEVAEWAKRNRKSYVFSLRCVFIEILAVLELQPDIVHLGPAPYHEILHDLRSVLNHKRTVSPLRSELIRICIDILEPEPDRQISAVDLVYGLNVLKRPTGDLKLSYFCDACVLRAPEGASEAPSSRFPHVGKRPQVMDE
jgi:hypothetical protein